LALLALLLGALVGAVAPLALAPPASAHVERPSYWPDPKPDCSVSPCAGGKVPDVRTLASALDASQPGDTRVVCQADSLQRLQSSITAALQHGYDVRPTEHHTLSQSQATQLLAINQQLFAMCTYHQIQAAVTDSGNNDRVVVMPGLYTEPTSRAQPTHDPACAQYAIPSDSGDPGALSHDYQIYCPNDANLVAVIGRGPDTAPPPNPPLTNRHGIPNVGPCIRCNLQLEGSGVSPDDVIVEAGDPVAGDGGPSAVGNEKDVGIFVDRADGFVLRNLVVRHAREHDIYILETDGYRFSDFKTFYAGGYGVLTFVEDHGVIEHCEAAGNGDSGIYPGSGADSTDHRYLPFYPVRRYSQVIRDCDMHHNTGGMSGTDSHGTLITHNNFYDNALGFTVDVFTAPGHPGYPQHGNTFSNNNFYDNNFNPYVASSDVAPFIPAPVGTGGWIAGGNENEVVGNRFWNNWRRGLMIFAVPDATVCGPPPVGSSTPVPGCDPLKVSTSYNNRVHGNVMGVDPSGHVEPNGVDFWWDSFLGNTGNCWWGNKAAPGRKITSSPGYLPGCANGTNPRLSIGTTFLPNELELVGCEAGFTLAGYPDGSDLTCNWTKTPKQPGTTGRARPTIAHASHQARRQQFATLCAMGLSRRLCSAYQDQLPDVPLQMRAAEPTSTVLMAKPRFTPGRLSTFTCDWWRSSDDSAKHGMVRRIRKFASGPVNGGPGSAHFGYGAALTDNQAAWLFEDRCSTFQAGPFALYKLYGAAAPFAAAFQ
jgi:hypothetical protein